MSVYQDLLKGVSEVSNAGAQAGQATSIWGNIFGLGNARQLSQQNKLNEQAAATNYTWGKKAADDAFARTMSMYEREFQDNLPEAQKKRLLAAGFNPALMYGGMGTTGGANVGNSPIGDSGGAVPGSAPNSAEQQMAHNQSALVASQTRLNNANAGEAEANANRTNQTLPLELQQMVNNIENTELRNEYQRILNEIQDTTKDIQIEQIKEELNKTIAQTKLLGIEGQAAEQKLYEMWDRLDLDRKLYALSEKRYKLDRETFEWQKNFDPYKLEEQIKTELTGIETHSDTTKQGQWIGAAAELAKILVGVGVAMLMRNGNAGVKTTEYLRNGGKITKAITTMSK